METMVNIADNSGAKLGKVIHHWRKPQSSSIVRISCKIRANSKTTSKASKSSGTSSGSTGTSSLRTKTAVDSDASTLALALVVRENRSTVRLNGLRTRFFDNAVVLLDAASVHDISNSSIKGTRIFGPVTCALRKSSSLAGSALKILSLAGGVV